MFSVAVYLFWSLLFYNTTQAPNWYEGSCAMIAMGVFLLIMTIVCYLLQRRQEKQELSQTIGWDMDDAKPTQSVIADKA